MKNTLLKPDMPEIPDATTPRPFPPSWADAWGDDAFGLWADAEVRIGAQVLTQRMRWIRAGSFLMGSPTTETGSRDNERPQHRVTISAGFWLADAACAQGFWQAVMGDNPSHFTEKNRGGLEHPVEKVSWNMIQSFLQRLEALLPDCRATLPTEAEWEYACRAATYTPFSFGDNVTVAQVNYDGRHPYAGGKKGEYRGQSVAVKDLPANAWGLYQMHGNVWEWCADHWRDYGVDALCDPGLAEALDAELGDKDAARVLRGGGWFSLAQDARSAFRDRNEPDGLLHYSGLRLALRSRSPASRPEA